MGWTAEKIATVKRLWAAGLTTSQIAREVGVSKNAVVGKVHRLGLAPRQSPIRRRPDTVIEIKGPVCAWPVGEPGSSEFSFCGQPAVEGKPYCGTHCEAAYIRANKREKDADAA